MNSGEIIRKAAAEVLRKDIEVWDVNGIEIIPRKYSYQPDFVEGHFKVESRKDNPIKLLLYQEHYYPLFEKGKFPSARFKSIRDWPQNSPDPEALNKSNQKNVHVGREDAVWQTITGDVPETTLSRPQSQNAGAHENLNPHSGRTHPAEIEIRGLIIVKANTMESSLGKEDTQFPLAATILTVGAALITTAGLSGLFSRLLFKVFGRKRGSQRGPRVYLQENGDKANFGGLS